MKPRITDPRLREILEQRFSSTLRGAVVHEAYKVGHLIVDAQLLSQIDLMFDIVGTPDGRLAVPLYRRWHIVFDWDTDELATGLSLKRLE